MPRDPSKVRARRARYLERKKVAKYGPEAAGVDMRGRHGNHARGERNARFGGGRFVTSQGYVAVRVSADHPHAWGAHPEVRYAYEHILVMEAHLGRPLRDDEVVHHRDEDKTHNAIENLEVLTAAEHMREHARRRGGDRAARRAGGPEDSPRPAAK